MHNKTQCVGRYRPCLRVYDRSPQCPGGRGLPPHLSPGPQISNTILLISKCFKTRYNQRPSTKLLSIGRQITGRFCWNYDVVHFSFFKDSSNRKTATACNPYMIGHVANELRHNKFREDRMVKTGVISGSYFKNVLWIFRVIFYQLDILPVTLL